MGHYDERYEQEDLEQEERIKRHREKMIRDGFIKIPQELQTYIGNQEWIHSDTLRHLRAWLIDDTLYNIIKSDQK